MGPYHPRANGCSGFKNGHIFEYYTPLEPPEIAIFAEKKVFKNISKTEVWGPNYHFKQLYLRCLKSYKAHILVCRGTNIYLYWVRVSVQSIEKPATFQLSIFTCRGAKNGQKWPKTVPQKWTQFSKKLIFFFLIFSFDGR